MISYDMKRPFHHHKCVKNTGLKPNNFTKALLGKLTWSSWKERTKSEDSHFLILILLQSYNDQNTVELAEGHTYRSIEKNWESRNKPMCQWSIDFWQESHDHSMRKNHTFTKQCGDNGIYTSKKINL